MTDDPLRWSKADIKLDKELELNLSQKKDLKRAFDYFDKNGTGVITPNYLKIAFRALGYDPSPNEMKKLITEIESDKGGILSFNDFLEIITKKMIEQEDDQRVVQEFRILNLNQGEGITFEDLAYAREELQADLNDEELLEMIEEGDIQMKGCVTLPDFKYITDRFYRMQSKEAKWAFKYPKNFDYYAVCSRKARDWHGSEEGSESRSRSSSEGEAEDEGKAKAAAAVPTLGAGAGAAAAAHGEEAERGRLSLARERTSSLAAQGSRGELRRKSKPRALAKIPSLDLGPEEEN